MGPQALAVVGSSGQEVGDRRRDRCRHVDVAAPSDALGLGQSAVLGPGPDDDRHPGHERLEQLVRERQSLVQRAWRRAHEGDVRAGGPVEQLRLGDRRQDGQPAGASVGLRTEPRLEMAEAEEGDDRPGGDQRRLVRGGHELLDPLVDAEGTLVQDDRPATRCRRRIESERGRQTIGGDRAGHLGSPGRRTVEEHDRGRHPKSTGDLGRHRGRRGEDPRRLPDQAALASPDERAQHARQLDQPGRLGVEVGDVVDEPAPPSRRAADRRAGDRQGDQGLRMDDVRVGRRGRHRPGPGSAPTDRRQDLETAPERGTEPVGTVRIGRRQGGRVGSEPDRPEDRGADGTGQRPQALADPPVELDPAELDPVAERHRRGEAGSGERHDRHPMPIVGQRLGRLEQPRLVLEGVRCDDRDPKPARWRPVGRPRPGRRHRWAGAVRTRPRAGFRTGSRTCRPTAPRTASITRPVSSPLRPA